jgi:shikimate dehydrogenase
MIGGDTKLLGLLGRNTSYTLSPIIHNTAIKSLGLDLVYTNFDYASDDLSTFLRVFENIGGAGLNITQPFKQTIAKLIAGHDLKSVNTLKRESSGWTAHSTDGPGFIQSLTRQNIDIHSFASIITLGAGGAIHAICSHLIKCPWPSLQYISIIRRNNQNDSLFADHPKSQSIGIDFKDWTQESLQKTLRDVDHKKTLIIQAVPSKYAADALLEISDVLTAFEGTLVDLNYMDLHSYFFKRLNSGLQTVDGLGMLIEQARLSQVIWWGKCLSYEDIYTGIKKSGRLR